MSDLGKLAGKLAARRVTFAKPRARKPDGIDLFCDATRYPTAMLLCAVALAGIAGIIVCCGIWLAKMF